LRPPAQPVEGEAVQFAHRRGTRRLLRQGPQDAACVLVPLPPEGGGRILQPRLEPLDAVRCDRPLQVVLGVARPAGRGAGVRTRPRTLAATAPGALAVALALGGTGRRTRRTAPADRTLGLA